MGGRSDPSQKIPCPVQKFGAGRNVWSGSNLGVKAPRYLSGPPKYSTFSRFFGHFPAPKSTSTTKQTGICLVWHLALSRNQRIYVWSGSELRGLRPRICLVRDQGIPPIFGGPGPSSFTRITVDGRVPLSHLSPHAAGLLPS